MVLSAALTASIPGVGAGPDGAPANLLLITLDTFRGDHLGANGAAQVDTPCLDRLAAAGANFTRARASVPLTLPSHASIMTGRAPHSHGVRDNGLAALDASVVTLAEVLGAEGYATAAFVGSFVLDHRFGLDQGFEHYDDQVATDLAMLERPEAERDGAAVVGAFEDWLSRRASDRPERGHAEPFFAWIHLYDPHAPYQAPEPFRSKYPRNPYAAEIAYTDSLACRAVEVLEAQGVVERTLIAAVGDHGEGLGEHGEATHSLLIYNSTLHVPMLMHRPGRVPAVSVPDLVRTIDLAPTLLDYLNLGREFGEGSNLRSRIERDSIGTEEPNGLVARSESRYGERVLGWSPLFGLEEGRYHFIRAPTPELFDLERDPGESRNVFAEQPEVSARLASRLDAMLADDPGLVETSGAVLDSAEIAKLRSLGYLAGSGRSPKPPPQAGAVDPKAKIEIWEQLQRGIGLYERGEYADAARGFEAVLREERDLPLLFEYLSASYVRLGDWEKFERLHDLARARGVETAALHLDMGRRYRQRAEPALAEAAFERALALEPLSVTGWYELAELHRAEGRLEDAASAYREALAINPAYAFAWNGLGVTLSSLAGPRVGGADGPRPQAAALDAFERAVELAPGDPRSVLNLAVQLERMGRRLEALARYRQCLELADASAFPQAHEAAAQAVRRLQAQP